MTEHATMGSVVTLPLPYSEAVERVREALAAEGFGVLTEIDVRATLQEKLGEQMEDYLILGACNPPLAHAALEVDRSLGLLLPCNVVVRAGEAGTIVELLDPNLMVAMTHNPALEPVAREAASRLQRVAESLRS